MKNRKGQPVCGKTVEGPRVKDGGRSRPLWRDYCRRVVRDESLRCWQHGGPRVAEPTAAHGPGVETAAPVAAEEGR